MQDQALTLLRELTEAHSIPGHEDEVREIFLRELAGHGTLAADRSGSVFCELTGEGPRVMLAGHMDEVGFLVQNITPEGFLAFLAVGGWWEHNLLAQRVDVRTAEGTRVPGVIASRPPHFLPESQRRQVMAIEQMMIDIGVNSREEAEALGVRIGSPVAPHARFTELARPGRYLAKAFDNRVGMAGVIQAGQALAGLPRGNRTILAGTVQEEVGLRGARTAAAACRPDLAIVLEGPPADDAPGFARSESQGRLGGGVQIRLFDPSAIANPRLARFVIEVARREKIRHQVTVRRSGGTDAGSIHLAAEGVPCIVLGTPARYIHSHHSIIELGDYLEMVRLATALAASLDEETVAGFTRYL